MKSKLLIILAVMAGLVIGCNNDDEGSPNDVNIRVANSGEITLQAVIIDNNSFFSILPGQTSEFQKFTSELGLPPSYFTVKTAIGERGYVLDYAAGATIEKGFHTIEIGMNEDGDVSIVFPED